MNTGKSVRKGQKMGFKEAKILRQIAQENDLIFGGIHTRSRHDWVTFKDKNGVIMLHPLSRHESLSGRDILHIRAQMKRFARGQTHGLKLVQP